MLAVVSNFKDCRGEQCFGGTCSTPEKKRWEQTVIPSPHETRMSKFISTILPRSEGRQETHPLCIRIPGASYFQPAALWVAAQLSPALRTSNFGMCEGGVSPGEVGALPQHALCLCPLQACGDAGNAFIKGSGRGMADLNCLRSRWEDLCHSDPYGDGRFSIEEKYYAKFRRS